MESEMFSFFVDVVVALVWSRFEWQCLLRSRGEFYSPKRAGVCLGVMGASSLLPGVQIFTALNQERGNNST